MGENEHLKKIKDEEQRRRGNENRKRTNLDGDPRRNGFEEQKQTDREVQRTRQKGEQKQKPGEFCASVEEQESREVRTPTDRESTEEDDDDDDEVLVVSVQKSNIKENTAEQRRNDQISRAP